MTEQEWLTSTNPAAMLKWLDTPSSCAGRPWSEWKPNNRKFRLFACACCLLNGTKVETVDEHERLGPPDRDEPKEWRHDDCSWARGWTESGVGKVSFAARAALLREIVGNPFRLSTLCGVTEGITKPSDCYTPHCVNCAAITAWQDRTVTRLAETIYKRREWELLPHLADALMEAGCDNEDLLMHLRGVERCTNLSPSDMRTPCNGGKVLDWFEPDPSEKGKMEWVNCSACKGTGWQPLSGPHVRGCWALDLLLGKE